MVGMPGFWPDFDQISGQVVDQIFGNVFDQGFEQGFWCQKYSVRFYWGGEMQCTFPTAMEKYSFTDRSTRTMY